MGCPLCDMGESARVLIAELDQCRVYLNDQQGCPGWCVLVLKEHVEHLGALPVARQVAVFGEVARVAGAIRRVFATNGAGGGQPRINYECLGNVTPHVHWHVIPRHGDDPEPRGPVWGWSAERLRGTMNEAERKSLADRLAQALKP